MATIPLPALQVKTPEQPNMLDVLRQAAALKGQNQQNEAQAMQMEQQKRALADDTTIREAYGRNNGDVDKTLKEIAGKVSPQAFQVAQQHALDLKQKAAALVAQQGDIALKQSDAIQGAHDVVDKAPAEQKPTVYAQQIQGLRQMGIDVSGMPPQYPGDDAFKSIGLGIKTHSKLTEEALKESERQKNTAQAGEADAQRKKIEAEMAGFSGPLAEAKYRNILAAVQAKRPVSQDDMNWAKAFEASNAKTTTQSDSLGVTSTNTARPSGLALVGQGGRPAATYGSRPVQGGTATTPQSTKDSLVDAIGQYKYNPMLLSRLSIKHPEILAQVTQKYPDWSQPNYNVANKAVTDLAPGGKTGQQITSYNTFLRHAGALYDAVDSLDNSKYSDLLNKPLNWLAQHTGDARIADFMAAMQPPMKEFQSFLLNNHAMHEEDVKDAHSLIDVNKTPQEIKAVLKRFAETGSARLSEQNESFKRVTGRDIPNLVSSEAAKAYNKITGTKSAPASGMIRARDPQGKLHEAPAGTPLPQGWKLEQ